MTKEADKAGAAEATTPPPARHVDPDTDHLAEQMSRLLAELARTPEAELSSSWAPGVEAGEKLGRFTLLRELGRGGMGVVWEAEDRELRRSVALKVVRPGSRIAARGEEWLRREAEAVARLNHPNIVTLFDFGAAQTGPYLVFELLRGQPLDRRVAGGRLPLRTALHVGVEVARALVHAHRAGVVHRDLKPANVFVADDGAVKVLDFGLAHLLGRAGPGQGGTPTSMAPEQWRGEAGDERTDLFALGVLLHAALAGAVPYPLKDGRSAVERPGPTPNLPPGPAPRRLRRLVRACLERDPARRPASAQAVLDELRAMERSIEGRWRRRLVSGLAAVALTAVAGAGWLWWSREPPPGERLPVVVADVENRSGDPSLDGLSGLLAAALEPSRRLDLVPRPRLLSLARQAGMGELPRLDAKAARELSRVAGAKVLLTTAARRDGSGVLVEVRGTDPADDKALFTVAESGGAGEVAAVLDRLAEAVRRRLRERREDLAAGRSGVAEAVTASPEAARRYYQGIDCELRPSTFGKTSGQDCGEYFQQALAQDPAFPLAHYRLARLASWGGASPADIDQHLGPALRAASRLPGRDAALVRALEDEIAGRPDDAIRRYEEILARQPDDRDALISAGGLHYARSEWAAASTYYERITSADPGNDFVLDGLVRCLGSLGKRDALRALLDRVRSEPPSPDRTEAIVRGLVWLGEPERAVEAAQRAVAAGGGVPAESLLSSALLVAGRFEEAEALQRRRIASVPKRVPSRWSLAMILAGEGRQREALRVLDEAERTGEGFTASDHAYVRAVVAAATMEPAAVWREAAKAAASNSSDEPRLAVLLALLGDVTHAREIGAAARPGSVERDQLDALLVWRGGNPVAAQARLFAAEKRDPCPTAGLFPSHLLGEVASAAGDHRNVIGAAQRFGRLWPGGYWFGWASSRMLLLSARAHAALGERAEARTEVDRLLARLRRADPDLPLLGEARALRARL